MTHQEKFRIVEGLVKLAGEESIWRQDPRLSMKSLSNMAFTDKNKGRPGFRSTLYDPDPHITPSIVKEDKSRDMVDKLENEAGFTQGDRVPKFPGSHNIPFGIDDGLLAGGQKMNPAHAQAFAEADKRVYGFTGMRGGLENLSEEQQTYLEGLTDFSGQAAFNLSEEQNIPYAVRQGMNKARGARGGVTGTPQTTANMKVTKLQPPYKPSTVRQPAITPPATLADK